MTFPEVYGKKEDWPHACLGDDGEIHWRPLAILRTPLVLWRPPELPGTHPLVPKQLSNKTKANLEPTKNWVRKNTHQCSQIPTEHRLIFVVRVQACQTRRGPGSAPGHTLETLQRTRLSTSEQGRQACTPEQKLLYRFFLNHKRLVEGTICDTVLKYFLLTYYLFSRSLKYTVSATVKTLATFLRDKDKIKAHTQVKGEVRPVADSTLWRPASKEGKGWPLRYSGHKPF